MDRVTVKKPTTHEAQKEDTGEDIELKINRIGGKIEKIEVRIYMTVETSSVLG